MATTPLNGGLEVGLRALVMLNALFPQRVDLSRLVWFDYCLLHTQDFGGPDSIHPHVPLRSGELGVKRRSLEAGLHVMVQSGLVGLDAAAEGVVFAATDDAGPFISLLQSRHALDLIDRAEWVAQSFSDLDDDSLRSEMKQVVGTWDAEFEFVQGDDG